jgi:predicted N-acyltransferase
MSLSLLNCENAYDSQEEYESDTDFDDTISTNSQEYDIMDSKTPYNQLWDMEESHILDDKEKAYRAERDMLPDVLTTIIKTTPLTITGIASIIIDYMSPTHPDDTCSEDWCRGSMFSDEDGEYLWWDKGFDTYKEYFEAVRIAKKRMHRAKSLAFRWGCRWRWVRYNKNAEELQLLLY